MQIAGDALIEKTLHIQLQPSRHPFKRARAEKYVLVMKRIKNIQDAFSRYCTMKKTIL